MRSENKTLITNIMGESLSRYGGAEVCEPANWNVKKVNQEEQKEDK